MANSIVYNRDCLEAMRLMPDKCFDLAVVDPPYGIGMDNSKKRTKPSRPNSYKHYKEYRYHQTNWDSEPPQKEYFEQLFRVSKYQIIWGANYFNEYLPSGYGWIFWNKLNGLDNCFSDGEFAFSNKGIQSKYFECSAFDNLRGGKDRIHPTQKPVALYKWLFQNYAKPTDRILDTHLGSGSSRIAAYDAGLDFTGFEIDKEYYDAQELRFKKHISQQSLFEPQELVNFNTQCFD